MFGGYNAAMTTGNNITLPFASDKDFDLDRCASKQIVTLSDVKMNLKNGSSVSLIGDNSGAAFRACL